MWNPRMGGEKTGDSGQPEYVQGSPPRGRGKEVADEGIGGIIRITSAWAGKSPACRVHPCTGRDHPRVGGEKDSEESRWWALKGSPPHRRGKGGHFPGRVRPQGITPAWAGKSGAGYADKGRPGDHPRVGGEKRRLSECAQWAEGSPPRGRGKAACGALAGGVQRITPAWAGKSQSRPPAGGRGQDHPRVGGEKLIKAVRLLAGGGSPPRGRGKGQAERRGGRWPGITPAWAGKRLKRSHRSGIFISGPIPFHSVLHRPAGSGGSRAGRDGSLAGQPQNAGPA